MHMKKVKNDMSITNPIAVMFIFCFVLAFQSCYTSEKEGAREIEKDTDGKYIIYKYRPKENMGYNFSLNHDYAVRITENTGLSVGHKYYYHFFDGTNGIEYITKDQSKFIELLKEHTPENEQIYYYRTCTYTVLDGEKIFEEIYERAERENIRIFDPNETIMDICGSDGWIPF